MFDNAGVSSSSGEGATTFEEMGADAIAFIKALGLKKVDVLGFSIGGFVAQEITLQAPDLVRAPGAGRHRPARRPEHGPLSLRKRTDLRRHLKMPEGALVRSLHRFGSQPGGRPRIPEALPPPTENRDPAGEREVAPAQIQAIGKWGVQRKGSMSISRPFWQADAVSQRRQRRDHLTPSNSWILQQNTPTLS